MLTWTFFWQRLTKNPNYYNLRETTQQRLSEHLSEMVEQCFNHLYNANCITADEDMDVSPLNNGLIASYYYIDYTTIETFSKILSKNAKLSYILKVLTNAEEFECIPIRKNENYTLTKISKHLRLTVAGNDNSNDSNNHRNSNHSMISNKVNVLLQCHFERQELSTDISADLKIVLKYCVKLLHAMVDVLSTMTYFKPAICAIELSQMITQGNTKQNKTKQNTTVCFCFLSNLFFCV